ncbi:MAG: hypothetical protein GEU86_22190 [Actinophytocola sp.]|nr:hypothetical protein [Actinophytocola sp.]
MTASTPPARPTVTVKQIADLLAWARSLSEQGPRLVDPGERAAFLKAKIDLLGRIADDDRLAPGGGA